MRSADDLPVEPCTDALAGCGPSLIPTLVGAVLGERAHSLEPLRDATCQSFPVWGMDGSFARALCEAAARDEALDAVAERWRAALGPDGIDADLYELSLCLEEIARALSQRDDGEQLFVLLEEKAW